MIGSSLLHYRILARVGAGAMGEVFKAVDTRLDRFVALKLMATQLGSDASAKRRFRQEACAASALDHQNICAVHDIEETADGRLFLVMTFYDGETLASRLRRTRLPFDEAAAIVRQVAAGLARAHDFGIVHRDIKPENLMITRHGEVKILDFGLAKLRTDVSLTQPGVLLGTPHYMSPEQITGGPVDRRADIWALGVVLYEMLLGRRPFGGGTPEAVLHAIAYDDPPPVTLARPDVPDNLAEVVERALIKAADARIQSCHEILGVLARRSGPGAWRGEVPTAPGEIPPLRRSILVLPFSSLGGDVESEHFGLGLADEIITDLSRLDALRVIARTAAERVKASSRPLRQMARELDVQYIVEGGVRRQGNSLRVSANLIDARTGALLWAEQFTGVVEDVFGIQANLSRRIVEALRGRLSVPEQESWTERPLTDVAAYECYLKAKQEFVRYSERGLERALSYIDAARARVGDNVLLLSAAGQIYWQMVNAGVTLDRTYLARARECAERVLKLDPLSPHGHRILGMVTLLDGDIRLAIRLLESAAARDPYDTDTLSLLGPCYGYVGRPQVGVPWVKRLLEIDPLTPMYQCMPGILALMSGAFDEAVGPFATSFQMDPGNPLVGLCYGQCLALNHQVAEAIDVFDGLWRMFPASFMARLGRTYRSALLGRADEASAGVTPDVEAVAEWDLYHAWNLAECFSLVGEKGRALRWLSRAASRGLLNYPLLARLDPFLEGLRPEPGFQELLADVRRQWEELCGESETIRLAGPLHRSAGE